MLELLTQTPPAQAAVQAASYVAETQVLLQITTALGLAVVVERVVEFSKNAVDLLPLTSTGQKLQVPAKVNELLAATRELSRPADPQPDGEADEGVAPINVLVEPATDPDDGSTLRAFLLQIIAAAVGLGMAMYWNLHMFGALGVNVPVSADHILTGLFIGGGSAPAHILLRFLADRKVTVPESALQPVAASAPAAAPAAEPSEAEAPAPRLALSTGATIPVPALIVRTSLREWREITYTPYEPERLETIHVRSKKPDLIVFHHTAMPASSTFQDLVQVIQKDRGWITAYNCVITADGVVHGFCRWDRYGSHAKGVNARSLGVSLNGNFDNDPTDPWANHGRSGPLRPTEQQLDSAARVVALWTKLYDIPVRFNLAKQDNPAPGIIPHKAVANKSCPGNMFPYDDFQRLVTSYADAWETSDQAKDAIAAFRLKPYVYADCDRKALAGVP